MSIENSSSLLDSLKRFSGLLTQDEIKRLLEIQEQALPIGIRINPLKATPAQAIENLCQRYHWEVNSLPFCENGWAITHSETSPGGTIEHRMGQYYLQDAASMVPVSLFDFSIPRPLILDMAASPGGKTTHLIDRSQDKGFIIANDSSQGRIPALRSVLENWGGINQIITQFPGESFGKWFPEKFDIVLLDAPCSMETLRPTSNHPLRETSADERLRLQDRQIQLLHSGLQALKTGGQLVYATCSLAPEEDEAVINALLDHYPNAIKIQDVSPKYSFKTPGLTSFAEITYHPDLRFTLRLWPHLTGMSGFFCGLITKERPIETQHKAPPKRLFSKTQLVTIPEKIKIQILQQIEENYGFNLSHVLHEYDLSLFIRFDQIFLIPRKYLENFANFPYEYIGMLLGQWQGESLVPSHTFISRFGHQFTKGFIQIDEKDLQVWIDGRDIRHPRTSLKPKGQFLVVKDQNGRNLGLGKLLPKRLRNMLPKGSI